MKRRKVARVFSFRNRKRCRFPLHQRLISGRVPEERTHIYNCVGGRDGGGPRPKRRCAAPMGDEWGDGGVSEWLAGLWREATGFRAAEDCQKHLTAYEQQLIVAGLRCPCGAETSTDVQCAIIAASLRFELRDDAETMMRYHRDISISMVQELVEIVRKGGGGELVDVSQLRTFRPCLAAPDFDEGTRLVRETLKHLGYQVNVVCANSHVDVREATSLATCRYQLRVSRDCSMPDINSEDDSCEPFASTFVTSSAE